MLQIIENKIQQLLKDIEVSAANHNALVGGLSVLREMHALAVKDLPIVGAAVEALDPSSVPIVSAVESIVEVLD